MGKMPDKKINAVDASKSIPGEIIPIYKPRGITSFAVVRKIRQAMSVQKVGHAGTLDPLAEGLLIVLTGSKTKLMNEFLKFDKEYSAAFRLGVTSKSYDLETEIVEVSSFPDLEETRIEAVLQKYKGRIEQLPPEYSAAWIGGKRAYHLARRGVEVTLKPKFVSISSLDLVSYIPPIIELRVVCSSGTYIRSLARDLGRDLGCGAVLTRLVRTRIGPYDLAAAKNLEAITCPSEINGKAFTRIDGQEAYTS